MSLCPYWAMLALIWPVGIVVWSMVPALNSVTAVYSYLKMVKLIPSILGLSP
jgi:hypothetical protein